MKENAALKKQLTHEHHDLEVRIKSYEEERKKFEEERAEWKEEAQRGHQEILEQNDRLTVLSQQLAGTKVYIYTIMSVRVHAYIHTYIHTYTSSDHIG